MNAPIIWIIFPGVCAAILYLFQKWARLVKLLGIIVSLLLALMAWQIPIGEFISINGVPALSNLTIGDSLPILGRQFIITNDSRSILITIYFGALLWLVGATVISVSRLFVPVVLAISALLTAAISVEPFLFAALFIEMAVLICIPLFAPPGQEVPRGALRFLTFQTLGMLLVIFSGWMVTRAELNTNDPEILLRTMIILGLGLAIALSVFPFYSWIPMTAQDSPPYAAAFILFTLPEIITLFIFNFFSRYPWLPDQPYVLNALTFVGLIMIIGAGIWSIYQNHLGRIFGYAVITEVGLFLLTVREVIPTLQPGTTQDSSPFNQLPIIAFFLALLLPRGFNFALWALSLSIIKEKNKRLDFQSVRGSAFETPAAAVGLSLAHLSLAGFPLLAGYPVRAIIGIDLAQRSPILALLTILGFFGLTISALRSISILFSADQGKTWKVSERRSQVMLLALGCFILLLVGFFPQYFLFRLDAILP